jgi:hypothetical protein
LRTSHEAVIDPSATAISQPAIQPRPAIATIRQPASASQPTPRANLDTRDDNIATTADGGDAIATSDLAGRRARANPPPIAPAQRPVRTMAEPAGNTRLAASAASSEPIESLYAESAQLEQLLALVRDERVASGASAALSSELDGRVAGIDAALTQAGLDAADRNRLWQQRVDAMQQLVGIETTRALSARGESFNASLVSID